MDIWVIELEALSRLWSLNAPRPSRLFYCPGKLVRRRRGRKSTEMWWSWASGTRLHITENNQRAAQLAPHAYDQSFQARGPQEAPGTDASAPQKYCCQTSLLDFLSWQAANSSRCYSSRLNLFSLHLLSLSKNPMIHFTFWKTSVTTVWSAMFHLSISEDPGLLFPSSHHPNPSLSERLCGCRPMPE